jgi:hypothetical protein
MTMSMQASATRRPTASCGACSRFAALAPEVSHCRILDALLVDDAVSTEWRASWPTTFVDTRTPARSELVPSAEPAAQ